MKTGPSLTPIPSDTNKAGSKLTRHEEPGRTKEAGSLSPSADVLLTLQLDHIEIMTLNTHFRRQIIYLPAAQWVKSGQSGDLMSHPQSN